MRTQPFLGLTALQLSLPLFVVVLKSSRKSHVLKWKLNEDEDQIYCELASDSREGNTTHLTWRGILGTFLETLKQPLSPQVSVKYTPATLVTWFPGNLDSTLSLPC